MVHHSQSTASLHSPRAVLTFGILQLALATGLIVLAIIAMSSVTMDGWVYGAGISHGIYLIITGALAVTAGRPLRNDAQVHTRKCPLVASLVMSILATISSVGIIAAYAMVFFAISTVVSDLNTNTFGCGTFGCSSGGSSSTVTVHSRPSEYFIAFITLNSLLLIANLGQAIASGINVCKMPPSTTSVTYVTFSGNQPPAPVQYGYSQTAYGQPAAYGAQQQYATTTQTYAK